MVCWFGGYRGYIGDYIYIYVNVYIYINIYTFI